MSNIDFTLFIDAHSWWKCKGFNNKVVPSYVDDDAMDHTCPEDVTDLRIVQNGKYAVASAEQSFLQLDKEGRLEDGSWMAVTPCFRDEMVLDDIHFNIFLKMELFRSATSKKNAEKISHEIAKDAISMFTLLGIPRDVLFLVKTPIGYDVYCDDMEIGSYGARKTLTGKWYAYGTGLAEPRTSIAIQKYRGNE